MNRLLLMRYVLTIVAAAWMSIATGCVSGGHAGVVLETPVRVETTSSPAMFPEFWVKSPIRASGKALPEQSMERMRGIMRRALAKYPERVLRENLKTVYVLSDLRYSGIGAAGTNSLDCVYVVGGAVKRGYTDAYIEGTFHAEFSSILLRNFSNLFDEAAWIAANPDGFKYWGSGVDAVKQRKAGLVMGDALHEQGFLNEYGQSNMENDLNGFAHELFDGDTKVWELAEKWPRIRRKVELAIGFFEKVDAGMNRRFFEGLAR